MKKIIVLLLGVMIVVGCSKKPITEDEAIQIAKDDLKVSEDDEYSVIFGNNSYDEEKQEYRFYLVESEEKSYEYIIDTMSGEIKEKI